MSNKIPKGRYCTNGFFVYHMHCLYIKEGNNGTFCKKYKEQIFYTAKRLIPIKCKQCLKSSENKRVKGGKNA